MEHDTRITRAWVVRPEVKSPDAKRDASSALEEAVSLAAALPNIEVVGTDVVRLAKIQPGTLFGTGKIEELHDRFHAEKIDLLLIDHSTEGIVIDQADFVDFMRGTEAIEEMHHRDA